MTIAQPALLAFNRGLISQLGLARTDLKRMALSASQQTNLIPRMLGSAIARPGTQWISGTNGNQQPKYIPFIFSTLDVALYEMTNGGMRVILPGSDGTPTAVLTRPAVVSSILNGNFTDGLTGWTNADQAGATSFESNNQMVLIGTGFNAGQEYQSVNTNTPNVEHALRIVVAQGSITLNVGVDVGDGSYAFNLNLTQGTHSIAFIPSGAFLVEIANTSLTPALVSSVNIESAGPLVLPTPWAQADLPYLRWDQSADVIYVARDGVPPQEILRWGQAGETGYHSYSVVAYLPQDGPFLLPNVGPITLTPSSPTGDTTLTASAAYFQPGHVGALFKLTSQGQFGTLAAGGTDQWTPGIEVTGVGSQRNFGISVQGTFNGTIVLQRSVGSIGAWVDVGLVAPGSNGVPANALWASVGNVSQWTSPVAGTVYDGYDNQTIWYRIGFESTYTSGTANLILDTGSGGLTGICRITSYSSSTSVNAVVLTQPGNTGVLQGFGSTSSTQVWEEGAWSGVQGYPSAVAFDEGRLWWFGKTRLVGSVSDAYESFDETVTGDSGPLNLLLGSGPLDTGSWMLGLADLLIGTPGKEISLRSSVLGGAITPTDFLFKDVSTQGSAACPALKVDFNGIFLQRSGRRIYQLQYTPSFFLMDYTATDLTNFVPDIAIMENGKPITNGGFFWLAVQRQPDTRIHALLNDGTARLMIFDPTEDEHAWVKVQLAATRAAASSIVDCVVLPGQGGASSAEDLVYYAVSRVINGSTVYSLERWAREDECIGGTVNKNLDCHTVFSSVNSKTISGVSQLVGEMVYVWADGNDLGGPFIVNADGTVHVGVTVNNGCVGLGYQWQFQSTKLAYGAQLGTALSQKKKIAKLGVIAANMHHLAFQYGPGFNILRDLPQTHKGAPVSANKIFPAWDDATFDFPGQWDADARLCLQGYPNRPCILLACVIDMETRENA